MYFKGLCMRKLHKFDEAKEYYKNFAKYMRPKNYTLLMHFMFSIIFKKLRNLDIVFDPLTYCEFIKLVSNITRAT